jgi:outer membrane receptor protein involved in Fe transport
MWMFTLLCVSCLFAQETTGGLQGTVKDSTGAVIPGAKVTLTAPGLVGTKETTSDGNGYYRFANLPPATYTVIARKENFATLKREGVTIEVGHLPTLDLPLQPGGSSTVVEVTEEAPLIDVTTTRTMTNITQDVIMDVPHGKSFQSVIEFAPSARNEPLQGSNRLGTGTGGDSPGNGANGNTSGFSVAGGSDSENQYLVEGQSTGNIIGGYSHTNVPFDFIQEVQIKTSGIEAEHGGALGGVANVVMKKGSTQYHGSVFMQYENQAFDGSPVAYERKDPLSGYQTNGTFTDQGYQNYQPTRPGVQDYFPGFSFGGPLLPKWKDKAFFFVGFNPDLQRFQEKVNYAAADSVNGSNACPTAVCTFSQNTQTYYTTARVDVAATQNIRVFGSWLYQYQRQSGLSLPGQDSVNGLYNVDTGTNPSAFSHSLGYTAPNQTVNTGVDWSINPHLVATTRFGYYFENYSNFGYPTTGAVDIWSVSGIGGVDTNGDPLPSNLQQGGGFQTAAVNSTDTSYNANKAIQFNQDIAWFKSGWLGTHNFKFGYQMNRLSNFISQHANVPIVNVDPGADSVYTPQSTVGINNCNSFSSADNCQGQYGFIEVFDSGNGGKATLYNHAFFAQDAWTIGHGITINAGIRFEHENLPGEFDSVGVAHPPSGFPANPISFDWGSKIGPRLGAAWDVFKDGRMKVFGSYGKFYDVMKLNLAISSFGGQYWDSCFYGLNTANLGSIIPAFDASNRYCPQDASGAAQTNWAGGAAPAGLNFIENVNYRVSLPTCATCNPYQEGVAPGLKPYAQHEAVFGVDYELRRGLALEARWDRRRLDSAIEDSSIAVPPSGNETFVIVNPGLGVNKSLQGFCQFLYANDPAATPQQDCADASGANPNFPIVKAARSYDGVEFRLTKAQSDHWFGMFSYTYSRFRGNYTGLTSSELSDGGLGGRNSPNNSRAFDEPYFSYNSLGGSSSGLLPTDRPNAFKGYAYYELPWMKHFTSDFGIFQYAYSGSPNSTYVDAGGGRGGWAIYPFNRGEWADITQDPTTGQITVGQPYVNRTPWYTQTDFNFTQHYKIGESKSLSVGFVVSNLWNQHTVTALYSQLDSNYVSNYLTPHSANCEAATGTSYCYYADGLNFYEQIMKPFNLQTALNSFKGTSPMNGVVQTNSAYGKPFYYQAARNMRLEMHFNF